MDDSKSITIEGKKFKVNGDVNGEKVYMVRRFRIKKNPAIWLKQYTFPSYFWIIQNR